MIDNAGPARSPTVLDALDQAGNLADRLGQQTRIGRIGHIILDHRRVGPNPVRAHQMGLDHFRDQGLVQRLDRRRSAPGRDLHQRRGMRNPSTQRDPTEPLPADRVSHLSTQRFIAEPIPGLEEHQPQIGLDRDRWSTQCRVEMGSERLEETHIIEQRIHPSELRRHHQHPRPQQGLPQRRLIAYGPQHRWLQSVVPVRSGATIHDPSPERGPFQVRAQRSSTCVTDTTTRSGT